jgi:uncharacterized membrane protein
MLLLIPAVLHAKSGDNWTLRKEKNGIQVYTKKRAKSNIYMYRVKTKIDAPVQKVYEQVIDFRENLKYMELVDSLSFLNHREDISYINYMSFDMPWPVTNREMVMEMDVHRHKDSIHLVSNDLPGYVEQNKNYIQVEDFNEEWFIKYDENEKVTHITIQGWVNPGGDIPAWIVNLFSVRTPFRFISGILSEVK